MHCGIEVVALAAELGKWQSRAFAFDAHSIGSSRGLENCFSFLSTLGRMGLGLIPVLTKLGSKESTSLAFRDTQPCCKRCYRTTNKTPKTLIYM